MNVFSAPSFILIVYLFFFSLHVCPHTQRLRTFCTYKNTADPPPLTYWLYLSYHIHSVEFVKNQGMSFQTNAVTMVTVPNQTIDGYIYRTVPCTTTVWLCECYHRIIVVFGSAFPFPFPFPLHGAVHFFFFFFSLASRLPRTHNKNTKTPYGIMQLCVQFYIHPNKWHFNKQRKMGNVKEKQNEIREDVRKWNEKCTKILFVRFVPFVHFVHCVVLSPCETFPVCCGIHASDYVAEELVCFFIWIWTWTWTWTLPYLKAICNVYRVWLSLESEIHLNMNTTQYTTMAILLSDE